MFKVERFFLLATCKSLIPGNQARRGYPGCKVFGVAPVTVALADTVVTVAVVLRLLLLLLLLMLLPMLLLLLLAACYVALATCGWGLATCYLQKLDSWTPCQERVSRMEGFRDGCCSRFSC